MPVQSHSPAACVTAALAALSEFGARSSQCARSVVALNGPAPASGGVASDTKAMTAASMKTEDRKRKTAMAAPRSDAGVTARRKVRPRPRGQNATGTNVYHNDRIKKAPGGRVLRRPSLPAKPQPAGRAQRG